MTTTILFDSEDKPVERIPECTDPEHDCSSADPPCPQPQVQQINGKWVLLRCWKQNSYEFTNIFIVCFRFLAILACNTSCNDRHAVKGMDPAAHTGDGNQDIILVRYLPHWFSQFVKRWCLGSQDFLSGVPPLPGEVCIPEVPSLHPAVCPGSQSQAVGVHTRRGECFNYELLPLISLMQLEILIFHDPKLTHNDIIEFCRIILETSQHGTVMEKLSMIQTFL